MKKIDIKGNKFGKLTALEEVPERLNSKIFWECLCDCGNIIDRDLNASINLEKYGLIKLKDTDSLSGIKACGESVRLRDSIKEAVFVKQEENKNLNKLNLAKIL